MPQGESEIEKQAKSVHREHWEAIAEQLKAAEARGYERCLKEIDEKCPEVAHIVRARINAR